MNATPAETGDETEYDVFADPRVTVNADRSVTFDLEEPIAVGGVETPTVTLRRPKVGDLRAMDRQKGSDLDKTLYMLARLASLSPQEIDLMDGADLELAGHVVAGFTQRAKR